MVQNSPPGPPAGSKPVHAASAHAARRTPPVRPDRTKTAAPAPVRPARAKHAVAPAKHAVAPAKHGVAPVKHAVAPVKHAVAPAKHPNSRVKHAVALVVPVVQLAAAPHVAPPAVPKPDVPRIVRTDGKRSGHAPVADTDRRDHRRVFQLVHRPAAPAVSPESAGASPSGTGISPLAALIAVLLFAAPGFAWLLPAGVTLATGARLAYPLERPG
jgi:hypothetical protein